MFQTEDMACVFWHEPDLNVGTGEVLCCHIFKHELKQYLCFVFGLVLFVFFNSVRMCVCRILECRGLSYQCHRK